MSDTESKTRSDTAALIRQYYEAFNAGKGKWRVRAILPDGLRSVASPRRAITYPL